jgi:3-hydroxyacyl-[acyl-carrier-protein] dehydratase
MNRGKVAKGYKGTFYFDPADSIYDDHFPGNPVVPGSLIVHAFVVAVRKVGIAPDYCTIENFKFQEFIPPGAYPFSMELLPDRLRCRLYQGDRVLATGILKRGNTLAL